MQMKLDNNQVKASSLQHPLSDFTGSTTFVVKNIRENYEYVDGKKTDTYASTSLECVDPKTFETFKIKVTDHVNIKPEDLENTEKIFYVQIPTTEAMVVPYELKYGTAKVSITCKSVKILVK